MPKQEKPSSPYPAHWLISKDEANNMRKTDEKMKEKIRKVLSENSSNKA